MGKKDNLKLKMIFYYYYYSFKLTNTAIHIAVFSHFESFWTVKAFGKEVIVVENRRQTVDDMYNRRSTVNGFPMCVEGLRKKFQQTDIFGYCITYLCCHTESKIPCRITWCNDIVSDIYSWHVLSKQVAAVAACIELQGLSFLHLQWRCHPP